MGPLNLFYQFLLQSHLIFMDQLHNGTFWPVFVIIYFYFGHAVYHFLHEMFSEMAILNCWPFWTAHVRPNFLCEKHGYEALIFFEAFLLLPLCGIGKKMYYLWLIFCLCSFLALWVWKCLLTSSLRTWIFSIPSFSYCPSRHEVYLLICNFL